MFLSDTSNKLVIKANCLIKGFMDMSSNEYKLTLLLISKINRNDKEFRKQTVSVKEFSKLINSDSNNYAYFKNFPKTLLTRRIELVAQNGDILNINWFSYAHYKLNEGIMEIAFNSDLKDFLLDINIPYTKYFLDNVKDMSSKHSVRIYELLKQYYGNVKDCTIDYQELRRMIGVGVDEYKKYSDFKRRVLLKAQNELKKYSDKCFEFEEIRRNKKVISIKFKIHNNNSNDRENCVFDGQMDVNEVIKNGDIDKIIKDFKSKYNGQLDYILIKNLVKNKGIDCVKECVKEFANYVDNANKVEKVFYDFTKRYNTKNSYKKSSTYRNNKPIQSMNYEQREYDYEFFDSLYDNVDYIKKS